MTPWTVAHQVPLSMEFFRQKYWSGLLKPSPGDFPNPGIKSRSPALLADSFPSEPQMQETGMIPGLWTPGEENSSLLQLSYLGNPMDRVAWWATVHGVTESEMTEQLTMWLHNINEYANRQIKVFLMQNAWCSDDTKSWHFSIFMDRSRGNWCLTLSINF